VEGGELGIQWRREQTFAGREAEVAATSCGVAKMTRCNDDLALIDMGISGPPSWEHFATPY